MGYPSRGKGSNYGNQRQRSGNKFSSHSSKSTFKSVPSFVTPDDSVWVTIRGTHVLIKDGETASQAFKRTTGKDLSEPEKKIYDKPDGDNAKSLNTGNDKGSGGDKTNMQTAKLNNELAKRGYGEPKYVIDRLHGDKTPTDQFFAENPDAKIVSYNADGTADIQVGHQKIWRTSKVEKLPPTSALPLNSNTPETRIVDGVKQVKIDFDGQDVWVPDKTDANKNYMKKLSQQKVDFRGFDDSYDDPEIRKLKQRGMK